MSGSYVPTTWVEKQTKVGPTNLNKLEAGTRDAYTQAHHVFNVMDVAYGAKGDGTTDDTTAFASAYSALVAAGGGVLLLPPATYVGSIVLNQNVPCRVIGYGATLKPAANQIGISITTGNGMNGVKGSAVEGLLIDGGGGVGQQQGTTGIKINNSDWIKIRNVKVQKCVKGIHYLASGTGWCEASSVENCAVYECDTGIRYENTGSSGSFYETSLRDVGINSCTTGIDTSGNSGAGLGRTKWDNVTCWLARTGDTGVLLGAQAPGSVWHVNFESTVTSTAFSVTTNYDNGAVINSNFNGGAGLTRATVAAGLKIEWRDGNTHYSALGSGAADPGVVHHRQLGDANDRVTLGTSGGAALLAFGDGTNPTDISLIRGGANQWNINGVVYHATNGIGFNGTAPQTKPTVTGSKGANAALTSLLSALAAYGLITDSTT